MKKTKEIFGVMIFIVGIMLVFSIVACDDGSGSGNGASNSFVAVTNITNLPAIALVGSSLTLSGTVEPDNATNKSITWNGSGVSGGVFTAPSPGPYNLTATISNGASESSPYVKNFTINAVEDNSCIYIAQAQGSWSAPIGGGETIGIVVTGATWKFVHSIYGDICRGIIIDATANRYKSQVNEELQENGIWKPKYSYEIGSYSINTSVTPNTFTITPDPGYSLPGDYSIDTFTKLP